MNKINEQQLKRIAFDLNQSNGQQEEPDHHFMETIDAWLDDKHIHSKTRLNKNQIVALTILKTLAEKYKVKCIKELIKNFVRYKLSEGGQSSKELVDILKNRPEIQSDDQLMKAIEPFLK